MSRKPAERRTTRVGQMHLCAICEVDAAATGGEENIKKLTFMLEVPAESVTYVRLGGRCRTWFCRACVEDTCRADEVFAARNAHLVLEVPGWWNEPATAEQLAHLETLLATEHYSAELQEQIATSDRPTKGELTMWLGRLRAAPAPSARVGIVH